MQQLVGGISLDACLLPCIIEYRLVAKKGEGTFSEVLKAQSIKNGKYVAIKCMKNHFDSLDQVWPVPLPQMVLSSAAAHGGNAAVTLQALLTEQCK